MSCEDRSATCLARAAFPGRTSWTRTPAPPAAPPGDGLAVVPAANRNGRSSTTARSFSIGEGSQEAADPAHPQGHLHRTIGRVLLPHLETGLQALTVALREDLLVRIAQVQHVERLAGLEHDTSWLAPLLHGQAADRPLLAQPPRFAALPEVSPERTRRRTMRRRSRQRSRRLRIPLAWNWKRRRRLRPRMLPRLRHRPKIACAWPRTCGVTGSSSAPWASVPRSSRRTPRRSRPICCAARCTRSIAPSNTPSTTSRRGDRGSLRLCAEAATLRAAICTLS